MIDKWELAAEAFANVLVRENAALAALDMARVVPLLEEKAERVAAFEALSPAGMARPVAVELLTRISTLAAENRRLLDRAITAQGRVLGVMAGVVRQRPKAPRYGARGGLRAERAPLTLTLSSQA
jgi:hypothetical protein